MIGRRIRTIKPDFVDDDLVMEWPIPVRLLFILLWTQADDLGRLRAAPWLLKARLFASDADVSHEDIDKWLQVLSDSGRINRYEVRGQQYAEIVNWLKHQRIQRPSPSQLPANPQSFREDSRNAHGTFAEDSMSVHGGVDKHGTTYERVSEPCESAGQATQIEILQPFREDSRNDHGTFRERSMPEREREREGEGEREWEREARATNANEALSPLSADSLSDSERCLLLRNQWPTARASSEKRSLAAWRAATKKTSASDIEHAARAWLAYWQEGDNATYAHDFANWLRDERWREKPPARRASKGEQRQQRLVDTMRSFLEEGDER